MGIVRKRTSAELANDLKQIKKQLKEQHGINIENSHYQAILNEIVIEKIEQHFKAKFDDYRIDDLIEILSITDKTDKTEDEKIIKKDTKKAKSLVQ